MRSPGLKVILSHPLAVAVAAAAEVGGEALELFWEVWGVLGGVEGFGRFGRFGGFGVRGGEALVRSVLAVAAATAAEAGGRSFGTALSRTPQGPPARMDGHLGAHFLGSQNQKKKRK